MLRVCLSMIALSGCSLLFDQVESHDAGAGAFDADSPDARTSWPCASGFSIPTLIQTGGMHDMAFTADTSFVFVGMSITGAGTSVDLRDPVVSGDMPPYVWTFVFSPSVAGDYHADFTRDTGTVEASCIFVVTEG